MFFQKKDRRGGAARQEKDLYPLLHVTNSLRDYQQELVKKEVDSLWEISMVGRTFDGVLGEAVTFQTKLEDFEDQFSSIAQVADEFTAVKQAISQSVLQAQTEVEELRGVSQDV